jgi:hypothetical protein
MKTMWDSGTERLTMQDVTMVNEKQQIEYAHAAEAQAEIFWWAFQALPREAQWAVRRRLLDQAEALSAALAIELESWQAAGSEALQTFEAMLDD